MVSVAAPAETGADVVAGLAVLAMPVPGLGAVPAVAAVGVATGRRGATMLVMWELSVGGGILSTAYVTGRILPMSDAAAKLPPERSVTAAQRHGAAVSCAHAPADDRRDLGERPSLTGHH